MSNWMRRRIERSRARCEKAATYNRNDKAQPQTTTAQTDEQPPANRDDS